MPLQDDGASWPWSAHGPSIGGPSISRAGGKCVESGVWRGQRGWGGGRSGAWVGGEGRHNHRSGGSLLRGGMIHCAQGRDDPVASGKAGLLCGELRAWNW